ncbi:NUDIX hydrolase [Caldalkalibacillus mannanilyticus]|uniref:NUDIX hydrolase n=1 Tax=Caldalkalibacillus mannanilyticus TaxID=1418 RepID=UPI0004698EF9|nr:CoA pyrophosphatase [Caldalkalibacillus mannanilyticus]
MNLEVIKAALSQHQPAMMGIEKCKKYAVLIPLIEINGEVHILFEIRAESLRRQPGEICFPGGKVDTTDNNEQFTALRETSEELGISIDHIRNLFPLDYLLTPFGSIIYPFVGTIVSPEEIAPNATEVSDIFTVPLHFFLTKPPESHKIYFKVEPEADFPFDSIPGGREYKWQARTLHELFYYFEDKVIWGLTARILKHFIEVIENRS